MRISHDSSVKEVRVRGYSFSLAIFLITVPKGTQSSGPRRTLWYVCTSKKDFPCMRTKQCFGTSITAIIAHAKDGWFIAWIRWINQITALHPGRVVCYLLLNRFSFKGSQTISQICINRNIYIIKQLCIGDLLSLYTREWEVL